MTLKKSTTKSFWLKVKNQSGKTGLSFLIMGLLLMLGVAVYAQTPTIDDLLLTATPVGDETDDRLEATYTTNGSVVEVASAWQRAGLPFMDLYMPFDGGPANAVLDFSGWDHPITLETDTTLQPKWSATGGYNGAGAFHFDGNEYFEAGDIFPMSSSYTKTAWVNAEGDDFRNILGSTFNGVRDHHFKVNGDGILNAGHSFGAEIVEDPVPLTNGQWYFVAVTFNYDNGEMILYKDGVEVDYGFVHDTLRDMSDPAVMIGARSYFWGWKGFMDDPRIYDRALSPEQIYAMFNEGNDVIVPQETADEERWRIYTTPFSATEAGATGGSFVITIQGPEITDLSLDATSVNNHTSDDLVESHTDGSAVVETATAWFKNGSPNSLLYLPFEGGRLNGVLDFSGNDNHASFNTLRVQHPTWDASGGHDGSGAFDFDGNDYLEGGDILPLDAPYTKTAWIRVTGSGFRNIMSADFQGDNNHTFKVNNDGTLTAGHSGGTAVVQDPAALTNGQWYFAAVTFDFATGEMILYKDGVPVDSDIVAAPLRSVADATVQIGALDGLFGMVGNIDDARIYDGVLTPEQISSLNANGTSEMVAEETAGTDEWYVEVTPFAMTEIGPTYTSGMLTVTSMLMTDITDQTVDEGLPFTTIPLNDHVDDEDFTDGEITWSYAGNTELTVDIDGSNVATVTIPNLDWYGAETISFTATNPNLDEGTVDAIFTVTNINDEPILTEIGPQSTEEDTDKIGLSVDFTDADPTDTHTIIVDSDNTNVTVSPLSGQTSGSTYDLVLAADWNGTAQITVTVTDIGTPALSDVEIYTLTVNPVEDALELTEIGDQDTDEDTHIIGLAVVFTDPDVGATHNIDVDSDNNNVTPANFSGNTSGSTYDLILTGDWFGTAEITVTVTQVGSTDSDSEVYTLTVDAVNDAPDTILLSNSAVDERVVQGTVVGLFSTIDVDAGDDHTYSLVTNGGIYDVDNASFVIVGDTLKTNAEIDYETQDSYSILVQSDDGNGGTKNLNFTITVNDVDETGVEDFYNDAGFNIYPVPAVDFVTVEIDNPENKELLLEFYNATGSLVHSELIFDKKRVDLSGFKDGMYVVRVSGEQIYGTRKLIVKDR